MPWLLIAQPYDAATSSVVPVYISDEGFTSAPTDTPANRHFVRGLEVALSVRQTLWSGSEILGGFSSLDIGNVQIANGDGKFDYLDGYDWDGRPVEVRYTAKENPTLADFASVFLGTADGLVPGDDLQITLRDRKSLLDEQYQPSKFLGTGGIQGPAEYKDRRRPTTIGIVRQIAPIPMGTGLTLAYSDGPCGGAFATKDNGVPLTAGRDWPTWEMLQLATITQGYDTCDAEGLIRLRETPANVIVCDAYGRARGGQLQTNGRFASDASGWTLGAGWTWGTTALYSSENPSDAGWVATGVASRNPSDGLYGDGRARIVTENTGTGNHSVAAPNRAFVAGNTTTMQVKARAVSGAPSIQLLFSGTSHGANAWANFDLVNGVVGTKGAAATTTMVALGKGYYLCTMSCPVTASSTQPSYVLMATAPTNARSPSYAGAGRQVELQDFQLDVGATAVEYGGGLTRVAGTASAVTQAVATTVGKHYVLSGYLFRGAGTFTVSAAGESVAGIAATGKVRLAFRATAASTVLSFAGDAAAVGSLDDVVLREVPMTAARLSQFAITRTPLLSEADFFAGDVEANSALCPQRMGDFYDGGSERPIRDVVDRLVQGVGVYWYFDTLGRIHFGLFTGPKPVADWDLTDRAVLTLDPEKAEKRLKQQIIGWGRRWRPLAVNEVAGASEADKVALGSEWRTEAPPPDPLVVAAGLLAREERLDTAMDVQADAYAEAARRMALLGPKRRAFTATTQFREGLAVGDTVRLTDDRYGLSAGQNFVVLALDRDAGEDQHTLKCWG